MLPRGFVMLFKKGSVAAPVRTVLSIFFHDDGGGRPLIKHTFSNAFPLQILKCAPLKKRYKIIKCEHNCLKFYFLLIFFLMVNADKIRVQGAVGGWW